MPFYLPPDYLDNTPERQLAEALRRIITDMEQRRMDVATGFFDPRIWESLGDALPMLEGFRLLLGKEPDLEQAGGDSALDLRRYYRQKLQGELEALPFDQHYTTLIDGLLTFLQRETVQVALSY